MRRPAVVVRIADADNNDTLPCGATGDGVRQPDEGETPYFHLDDEEDFDFTMSS